MDSRPYRVNHRQSGGESLTNQRVQSPHYHHYHNMTTYATLSGRIRTATTREELTAKEAQLDRHYHAGTITTREFARLDGIIMDRAFLLDNLNTNPTITAP